MKKLLVTIILILILQISVAEDTKKENSTSLDCSLYLEGIEGSKDVPCSYFRELPARFLVDYIQESVSYQEYHTFEISGELTHHTIRIDYYDIDPTEICKNITYFMGTSQLEIFDLSVSKNGEPIEFKPGVHCVENEICYFAEPDDKIVIEYSTRIIRESTKFLSFDLPLEFKYPFDGYTLVNWEPLDEVYYTRVDKIIIPNSFVPVEYEHKNTCACVVKYGIDMDVDKCPPPMRFDLNSTYEKYLKEGEVSKELKKEFENNGVILSDDVKISKVSPECSNTPIITVETGEETWYKLCEWEIIDGKAHYKIYEYEGFWIMIVNLCDSNTSYLFNWDDVPGKDSEQLLKYLENELKIDLLEKSEIEKSDNNKTITITSTENSLTFKLNEGKDKVNVSINGEKTREYDLIGSGIYDIYGRAWFMKTQNTNFIWISISVGDEGNLINENDKRIITWQPLPAGIFDLAEKKFLFILDSYYKQYLKEGKVDNNLITTFKNKNYTLSKDAKISKINNYTWNITDNTTFFIIEEDWGNIRIYENKQGIRDETTGCYLTATFERTPIIKYIFWVAVLLISLNSIYFLWFYKNNEKVDDKKNNEKIDDKKDNEKIDDKSRIYKASTGSFLIWSFQEGLNSLTPLTRPTTVTLFDLTLLIPLIFISIFYGKNIIHFLIETLFDILRLFYEIIKFVIGLLIKIKSGIIKFYNKYSKTKKK